VVSVALYHVTVAKTSETFLKETMLSYVTLLWAHKKIKTNNRLQKNAFFWMIIKTLLMNECRNWGGGKLFRRAKW
jgi:hypothetical protein